MSFNVFILISSKYSQKKTPHKQPVRAIYGVFFWEWNDDLGFILTDRGHVMYIAASKQNNH